MTAKRYFKRHVPIVIAAALVFGTGCDAEDSRGAPWDVDAGDDTSQTHDATSQPDVPGAPDGADRNEDRPPVFSSCQDETSRHPTEVKLRGSPRIEEGLELNWSFPLPLPGSFGATEDVERVGAPSLMARASAPFDPVASFTSESRDDEFYNVQEWGIDTFTGAEVGGGSGGSSAETFRSISANPVVSASRSSGHIAGEYLERLDRFSLEVSWETNRSASSTGMPVEIPNPEREIGRFGMFPGGLFVLNWANSHLLGLDPNFFVDPEDRGFPVIESWAADADYLWGGGASSPRIEWVSGPRPDESVVLLRDGEQSTKWVRVDRCGEVSDVYAAPGLRREILWTGEGYLVLMDDEALPGGPRPIHVGEDGTVRAATFGCRNLVERQEDEWACLRLAQTGFTAVTFGPNLEQRNERALPGTWSTARLDLAADGGALVFSGTTTLNGERQFQVGVLGDDTSEAITIEPVVGDEATRAVMRDRIGVIGPSGVFVFTTANAVYGVETPFPGLANTRHPRTLYGGNESRGYVSVE
jgi:hypothetical protein